MTCKTTYAHCSSVCASETIMNIFIYWITLTLFISSLKMSLIETNFKVESHQERSCFCLTFIYFTLRLHVFPFFSLWSGISAAVKVSLSCCVYAVNLLTILIMMDQDLPQVPCGHIELLHSGQGNKINAFSFLYTPHGAHCKTVLVQESCCYSALVYYVCYIHGNTNSLYTV